MRNMFLLFIMMIAALTACNTLEQDQREAESSINNEPVVILESLPQTPKIEPTIEKVLSLGQVSQSTAVPSVEPLIVDARPTIEVYIDPPTPDPSAFVYRGAPFTNAELVNVRTGEIFRLSDFAHQTVFVHPMATWCSVCRESQRKLRDSVIPILNDEDVVFVSLSVETTINQQTLANYATEQGFNWIFAVATPVMMNALVQHFSRVIATPPSAPHFVLSPDGTASPLYTGTTPPDQTIDQILAVSQF